MCIRDRIRGGSGYIEEWLDPKILRDSHLGSIWEGTSNIISLDTIRALKKDNNIETLKYYLIQVLQTTKKNEHTENLLSAIDNVFSFVRTEIQEDFTSSSRKISSSLYYLCASIFLNSEGQYCKSLANRKKISELLIKYKINQNSPLERDNLDCDLICQFI